MNRFITAVTAMMLAGTMAQAQVTDEDIANDATITTQIVTNGMGRSLQRYSPLDMLNKDNVANLVLGGALVHLDVDVDVLVGRLVGDGLDARPLLDGADVEHVRRIAGARRPRYLEVADLTVDATAPVDEVVATLVEWCKEQTDVLTPSELEQVL